MVNHRDNVEKNESMSISSLFSRGQSWRKSLGDNGKLESEHVFDSRDDRLDDPDSHYITVENQSIVHEFDVLDKTAMEARSKQAWLDVIIQIYRNFVLRKLRWPASIPETEVNK